MYSDEFSIQVRFYQASGLSPFLFIVILQAITEVPKAKTEVLVSNETDRTLLFQANNPV